MRQPPSKRHKHKGLLVYQKSRIVWQHKTISSPFGDTSYYICPKCGILLEREFVHYCDECGQKLDWHIVAAHFKKAGDYL